MIEKYEDIGIAYTAFDEPINLKKINKLFNKKIENKETYIDSTGIEQIKILKIPYISESDKAEVIKEIIQEELLPIHQEFIEYKEAIKPLWIYGIRSYVRGSVLESHTDTLATHHVSSIIIVDKQVDKDWPLDIQDHNGNWHKIYAEPGDMILYESATNKHGRLEPFEGEFYRNFYLHYSLTNYKYEP